MTATRATPSSRSPRTPNAKAAPLGFLKESDGPPFGTGGDSQTEKPAPQGALSPSLFNSLQQRANKLKVLLGSLQASSGERVASGGYAENSPQPTGAPGFSGGRRESGNPIFVTDRQSASVVQSPASAPSKPDFASVQTVNGAPPSSIASRTRAGSWSSGDHVSDAGLSYPRGTQGVGQSKAQSRGKDAASPSVVILREGAVERSRSGGGESLHGAVRPPPQRTGPVPAPQHISVVNCRDAGTASSTTVQRRCASTGSAGAGAVVSPLRLAETRPPATRVPSEPPRVDPAHMAQERAEANVASNKPSGAVPFEVEGAGTGQLPAVLDAAAAPAVRATTAATAAAAAGAAGAPSVVVAACAGSGNVASTSPPVLLFRPHPPSAPPSRQPSWASSGWDESRRSSIGGGIRRRSSGGGSYSDGSGLDRPAYTPPLLPPLPAQPAQELSSRSPSSSPSCSASRTLNVGGGSGSAYSGALSFPPPLSQAQHAPSSQRHQQRGLSLDGSHSLAPVEDRPAATTPSTTVAAPLPPPPPLPKGVATKGLASGAAFGPQLPLQPLSPNATTAAAVPTAAVGAALSVPQPRSQAAEELSAILSSLAAVTPPPTAMPAVPTQHEPHQSNPKTNARDPPNVAACTAVQCSAPPGSGGGSNVDGAGAATAAVATTRVCTTNDGDGGQMLAEIRTSSEPRVGVAASGESSAGGAPSAETEAALVQALAVARASALAAFLRPEARVYRPRREGFRTARSGSSSPPVTAATLASGGGAAAAAAAGGGGGGGPAPGPGQVFVGVPASAAPFSGRGDAAQGVGSPRCCGYHSSGLEESARSPCGHRSASARSSRYEQLLVIQDLAGNSARQCGGPGAGAKAAGLPGQDFMRRNAVLLKKRQAWAAEAKRRGSRESDLDGSASSPRNHQAQVRHLRAAWTGATGAGNITTTSTKTNVALGRGRGPFGAMPHRSLVDLQRWAERREQRLVVLREEREAEERARMEAQYTFKPEIGERSRRLAKLARSRPSYSPIPGLGPSPPPPRTQTSRPAVVAATADVKRTSTAASHAATDEAGADPNSDVDADADAEADVVDPGSAMGSNRPPLRAVSKRPVGRPPRGSTAATAAPAAPTGRARLTCGNRSFGSASASISGTSAQRATITATAPAVAALATSLSLNHVHLLKKLHVSQHPTRGQQRQHHGEGFSDSVHVKGGRAMQQGGGGGGGSRGSSCAKNAAAAVAGGGGSSINRSSTRGLQKSRMAASVAAAAQLAAARNSRARGRYAASFSGGANEDSVVGSVADAINSATAALKLRGIAPARRASAPTVQTWPHHQHTAAPDSRARLHAHNKSASLQPPYSLPQGGGGSSRGSRSSLGDCMAIGSGSRRRRVSASVIGAVAGHGDPHNDIKAYQLQQWQQQQQWQLQQQRRRQTAPIDRLDLWESPRTHSPNSHTHGGTSCRSSLYPSPRPSSTTAILLCTQPPSPSPSAGCRTSVPSSARPDGPASVSGDPAAAGPVAGAAAVRLGFSRAVGSPAAAILRSLSHGGCSPERTPTVVAAAEGGASGIARRTIDMLAGPGGSGGRGSGGLAVRTARSSGRGSSTMGFGSDFSGSGGADLASSVRFSLSTDSSPFCGPNVGSPVFLMLGPGAVASSSITASPAAAVAASAAAAMVGPGGLLVHVPQAVRLSLPTSNLDRNGSRLHITAVGLAPATAGGDGDGGGGGGASAGPTLIAAPSAPGGLAVGAFRYNSLTPSPASSYMTLPYDMDSVVLHSTTSPLLRTTPDVNASDMLSGDASHAMASGPHAATTTITAATTAVPGAHAAEIGSRSAASTGDLARHRIASVEIVEGDLSHGSSSGSGSHLQPSSGASTEGNGVYAASASELSSLSSLFSSSGAGVEAGFRAHDNNSPRDCTGTTVPSLRPEPTGKCSAAATATARTRGPFDIGGPQAPQHLQPRNEPGASSPSLLAHEVDGLCGAYVSNTAASGNNNDSDNDNKHNNINNSDSTLLRLSGISSSSPALVRNSAPLPMATNAGPVHGGLLRGVRFTKILAQQFAASLLLSQPASRSAVAAAAALGAAAAAATDSSGGAGQPASAGSADGPGSTSRDTGLSAACCVIGGGADSDVGSLCLESRSVSAPSGPAGWLGSYCVGGGGSGGRGGSHARGEARAAASGFPGLRFETVSLRASRRPQARTSGGDTSAAFTVFAPAIVERGIHDGVSGAMSDASAAGTISAASNQHASSSGTAVSCAGWTTAALHIAVESTCCLEAGGPEAGAGATDGTAPDGCNHGQHTRHASVPVVGAHDVVTTILGRPTVSDAGADASGEHLNQGGSWGVVGVEEEEATGSCDGDGDGKEEDALAALQSLIFKMKNLAGEGDAGDCGSESLRATTARSSSSRSGSGNCDGDGDGDSGDGNRRCAGPPADGSASTIAAESSNTVAVAVADGNNHRKMLSSGSGAAPVTAAAAAVPLPPLPATTPLDAPVSASAAAAAAAAAAAVGVTEGFLTSADVPTNPGNVPKLPGADTNASGPDTRYATRSDTTLALGSSVSLAEPLPVEVLVQRAEQLRESILGATSARRLSRVSSPAPAAPAISWTSSVSQHASPYSALGQLYQGFAASTGGGCGGGSSSSSSVAAVVISPVQLRYCNNSSNNNIYNNDINATNIAKSIQRPGGKIMMMSVSAGSGAATTVSPWRVAGGAVQHPRSASIDAGGEFVFPRLRSEAVAANRVAGVQAIQLGLMGMGQRPNQPTPAVPEAAAATAAAQGPPSAQEGEVLQEISLAGGLDQVSAGEKKSPRRTVPTARDTEGERPAAVAAHQPRYSVWSLADHLPAAVASAASASTSAGTSTAVTGTRASLPMHLSLPLSSSSSSLSSSPLSTARAAGAALAGHETSAGAAAPCGVHAGWGQNPPFQPPPCTYSSPSTTKSSQEHVDTPSLGGERQQEERQEEGRPKRGGDSLAALQSLIWQVAHL